MRDKKKLVKTAVILAAALLGLVLLWWLNALDWSDFSLSKASGSKNAGADIVFADPDYESNIFENEAYLDKNRYISYTDGAQTTLITDGNFARFGPSLVLFAEYFDALMHGDAERVNALFTEEYFKKHDRYERFTMQKIYNIEIALTSEETFEDNTGAAIKRYTYTVRYMIMANDGTFRSDMGSDSALPQLFELTLDDEIKISAVSGYRYASAG